VPESIALTKGGKGGGNKTAYVTESKIILLATHDIQGKGGTPHSKKGGGGKKG